MKPAPFEYLAVDSAPAAVAARERHDGNARCLAGGQSLVALLNMRLLRPSAVVDLNRVPGLDDVRVDDAHVRVGALTRYAALERSAIVAERLSLLAGAIPFVGDRQIRNRGTLGGAAGEAADPSSDVRASAEYRRHLVPIFVERALAALAAAPAADGGRGEAGR